MTTLNKSERVIANAESVKKEIGYTIKMLEYLLTDGYISGIEIDSLKTAIPKLNAIIEIMEN